MSVKPVNYFLNQYWNLVEPCFLNMNQNELKMRLPPFAQSKRPASYRRFRFRDHFRRNVLFKFALYFAPSKSLKNVHFKNLLLSGGPTPQERFLGLIQPEHALLQNCSGLLTKSGHSTFDLVSE